MYGFEIHKRVKEINALSCGDDGDALAHAAEDKLMLDFITFVSTLDPKIRHTALMYRAKLVLKTNKIEFTRGYT